MKVITYDKIKSLNISPEQCVDWVTEAFIKKYDYVLPPKISVKIPENIFFNTMPSYLPDINRFGVKVVSRYPKREPSLKSEILLYDSEIGECLALIDGGWITAMRTGAVAALAIKTLRKSPNVQYAFMGLGNTARATLLCMSSIFENEQLNVKLLAYKEQELDFVNRFRDYSNIHFQICHTIEDLISDSDVIVSAITSTDNLIAKDTLYKKGVLLVPIHTRGFQNCDLSFDKVFADDTDHVIGFKYFNEFKKFNELSNVLLHKVAGRETDEERIISYNIGISIHDIYIASEIYNVLMKELDLNTENLFTEKNKFWI